MHEPAISVVTSCFNASQFLTQAIESILGQSLGDFEFLLLDDGSTDDTLQMIQRYAAQDRRIVVLAKAHSGLIDSLNLGLVQARGEIVARMDADDVALPQRLERQFRTMRNSADLLLLGSGCVEIDEDGQALKRHSYPASHASLVRNLERMRPFFPHSSVMFGRKRALELGGYRARFVWAEDRDLWLRMALAGTIGSLSDPLVMIRKHPGAVSSIGGGKPQQVVGTAATVCHLRRKARLSDPSEMNEDRWAEFLVWIEGKLEEEGYLAGFESLQELRNAWYAQPDASFLHRVARLWHAARRTPRSLRVMFDRVFGYDIAIRLAQAMPPH